MTTSVNRKYSLDNLNLILGSRVAYAFFNVVSHKAVSMSPYNFGSSGPVQPLRGCDVLYSSANAAVQTFVDTEFARLSVTKHSPYIETVTYTKGDVAASSNRPEEIVDIILDNYKDIFIGLQSPFCAAREFYVSADVIEVCFELLLRLHSTMHSDRVLDPSDLAELMTGYFGLAHGFREHCPRGLHFTDFGDRVLTLRDPTRGYAIYVLADNGTSAHTLTVYSQEGRRIEKFQSQLQIIDTLQRAMGKTQNSSISGAVCVGSGG